MARHKINIRGRIIPNDYKWFYDFFEEDSACPRDVQKVLDVAQPGDDIDVYINSPGGVIDVGSEIYTLLREAAEKCNVEIYITGEACSAASVIACAAHSTMAPTALMMVHCVSSWAGGNHTDMEHMAEVLRTADRAMCTAYTAKTGMTEEEALDMMEHETWLTAAQAKEKGLVDEVMFEEAEEMPMVASSGLFKLPTKEQMEKVRATMGGTRTVNVSYGKLFKAGVEVADIHGPDNLDPVSADSVRRMREYDALMLQARRN